MIQDRRRYKRFIVDNKNIYGEMLLASDVKIFNISVGGILLKTDRRLILNRKYVLKLEDKNKILEVKGTVVRCILSESYKDINGDVIPVYTAGMKFTSVSKEKMSEIVDFIMLMIHFH